MRESLGSISFNFNNFAKTSAFAFSTSGFRAAADDGSGAEPPADALEEAATLPLLSEEPLREVLLCFFLFATLLFFVRDELDELPLLSLGGRRPPRLDD